MTGKEFEALPHVPEEIQIKCNVYLHQIPYYKEVDFSKNDYRLIVRNNTIGILVKINATHELRFCPILEIM